MPDWISTFMSSTDTLRSGEHFRLWTAISVIAAILERRVWTETDNGQLYPNMFIVLAGGPASGKTIIISEGRKLLSDIIKPGSMYLAPDDVTKASFLDALEASTKASTNGMGMPMYSAMYVMCLEFGVLLSKYDTLFAATLTTLYDNPPNHSSKRRTTASNAIEAPAINVIAAATPAALHDIIPESAWDQGLTSRMIFIYGTIPIQYRDMFAKRKDVDTVYLRKELKRLYSELHGEFDWELDVQNAMRNWFNVEKMAPIPNYGRLVNYCGRRNEHIMKLSMISAVSAGHGLTVTLSDFRRAQQWLFSAERTMPDVFRAMRQSSDAQLLIDCHHWLYVRYSNVARDKRRPISEKEVWSWFENKTTHDKIAGLMLAMEKTGRMRMAGFKGAWIPNEIDPDLPTEVADVTGESRDTDNTTTQLEEPRP